jgi:hypothetical protein
MTNDRNYYRMLDDDGLINMGRDSMDELAIVLADRLGELQDIEEKLKAVTNERDELDARCDIWKQQAIEAMDDLDALRGAK